MIHAEPKFLIIRGGDSFKKYGDPYDYCVSVFMYETSAHLFGLCGKFTFKDFVYIKNKLTEDYGITHIEWERKKKHGTKLVQWNKE